MSAAQDVVEGVVAAGLLGAVAASWLAVLRSGARRERAALRAHRRANRAHYAAVEAAEDVPIFSPDEIGDFVTDTVALAAAYWRTGEFDALIGRGDARLVRTWARSRQSSLGSGLEVPGKPSVDLLGVVNRDNEGEDRITVRVRLHIHCNQPKVGLVATRDVNLDERWALGRSDNRWILLSVSGDPLAGPALNTPLVPNRSYDDQRLLEESLAELADSQKVGKDVALSDLVNVDAPPDDALLDLSVVDPRFQPALIGAELNHLLELWEAAITGSEAPLKDLATTEARRALLRPGRGQRLVMRDAVLKSWETTKLDLSRQPPAIEVRLDVEAVRYVATNGGQHVAGNEKDRREMILSWTLELADSAKLPWRLAVCDNPAKAIPGWA